MPDKKQIAKLVAQRHSDEANAFVGAHLGEPLTEVLTAQIGMIWDPFGPQFARCGIQE